MWMRVLLGDPRMEPLGLGKRGWNIPSPLQETLELSDWE